MASNEDYLDSLLKAAMDSEQAEQDPTETLVEQQLNTEIEKTVENTETMDSFSVNDDPNRSLTPEEIAAMFAELSGVDETNESDETSALDTSNASETINEPESTSEPEIPNDSETFDIGDVMEEAISEEMLPDEMIQEEVIQPDEDPFQTDEELEFECNEGHKVFTTWKKLRNKTLCPICEKN